MTVTDGDLEVKAPACENSDFVKFINILVFYFLFFAVIKIFVLSTQ